MTINPTTIWGDITSTGTLIPNGLVTAITTILTTLPTTLPLTPGILWNNGGVICESL